MEKVTYNKVTDNLSYEEVDTWEAPSILGITGKKVCHNQRGPYRFGYWHEVWGKNIIDSTEKCHIVEEKAKRPKDVVMTDWQTYYKGWKDISEEALRDQLSNIWQDVDGIMGFMMRGGEPLVDGWVKYRCLSYIL